MRHAKDDLRIRMPGGDANVAIVVVTGRCSQLGQPGNPPHAELWFDDASQPATTADALGRDRSAPTSTRRDAG